MSNYHRDQDNTIGDWITMVLIQGVVITVIGAGVMKVASFFDPTQGQGYNVLNVETYDNSRIP